MAKRPDDWYVCWGNMTLCSVVLLDKLLRFVCGVICISSIVLWLWHIRIGILRLLADWGNTLLLYYLVVFWLGSPWCVVGSTGSVIDCSEQQYVHMVDNLLKSPFVLSCEVLELCTPIYQEASVVIILVGEGYTDRTPVHAFCGSFHQFRKLRPFQNTWLDTVCWGYIQFSTMLEDRVKPC